MTSTATCKTFQAIRPRALLLKTTYSSVDRYTFADEFVLFDFTFWKLYINSIRLYMLNIEFIIIESYIIRLFSINSRIRSYGIMPLMMQHIVRLISNIGFVYKQDPETASSRQQAWSVLSNLFIFWIDLPGEKATVLVLSGFAILMFRLWRLLASTNLAIRDSARRQRRFHRQLLELKKDDKRSLVIEIF